MPSWSRLARNIARKALFTVVSQMRTSGSQAPTQTRKSQRNSMPSDGSQPRPLGAHSIREVDLSEGLAHTSYDPDPDGDADPGEVVWTWVPYEEDVPLFQGVNGRFPRKRSPGRGHRPLDKVRHPRRVCCAADLEGPRSRCPLGSLAGPSLDGRRYRHVGFTRAPIRGSTRSGFMGSS